MTSGRKLVYATLPYFYFETFIIGGWGLHGVYEEPNALLSAFEASAARMVAAMPQAKLTVEEVTTMLVDKHRTHRHDMGSVFSVVPRMFSREAARSMA